MSVPIICRSFKGRRVRLTARGLVARGDCKSNNQPGIDGAVAHHELKPLEAMPVEVVTLRRRPFTSFRFLSFDRDDLRVLVVRQSLSEVALLNGWRVHTDGVHCQSRGGMIVADLVQEIIDGNWGWSAGFRQSRRL
jgi:hypothetical protein